MALYKVHWFYELLNAFIQHFSGHPLWTVTEGTSFLLLGGVGWELSMMFAVAGLIFTKILPEDPKKKIFGINSRILFVVINAAFFSVFEIFLAQTPTFHRIYPWWRAFSVFIFVYTPFFIAVNLAYDWKSRTQKLFIGSLAGINAFVFIFFGLILNWI